MVYLKLAAFLLLLLAAGAVVTLAMGAFVYYSGLALNCLFPVS